MCKTMAKNCTTIKLKVALSAKGVVICLWFRYKRFSQYFACFRRTAKIPVANFFLSTYAAWESKERDVLQLQMCQKQKLYDFVLWIVEKKPRINTVLFERSTSPLQPHLIKVGDKIFVDIFFTRKRRDGITAFNFVVLLKLKRSLCR